MIGYIQRTIHLPLVLGSDGSGKVTWNIDASYAAHPDMRSHTGATCTLGHGSILSLSSKQKITTRSSTEAELVGVDDAMTFILWMKYFLREQARTVPENSKLKSLGKTIIVEQDNTSSILLQRNGKRSSTKRTKHINIRYFFITDKLRSGEITDVVHKGTADMEADTLTKGLQGSLFLKHQTTIMGLTGINEHSFSEA